MEITAYVCSHVFLDTQPIRLVSREDGDWQLLCGGTHASHEIPHVVGLNHLIERDPTLIELHDLPDEWEAERKTVGSAWVRTKL